MKKLIILILPTLFLFSCNTELSSEQVKTQYGKQCKKQLAKQYLEDTATDEEKDKFCDCYTDYLLDGAETVTMKEILQRSTKMEELGNALLACSSSEAEEEPLEESMEEEELMQEEPMEEPAE